MEIIWNNTDYLEGTYNNFKYTDKLAIFDMDDTLTVTKSGKTHFQNPNDWLLFNNNVKPYLHKLYNDGFCIIIISNQMGINKGKVNIDDLKKKVNNVFNELNIPIKIFCSKGNDIYRKPHPTFYKIISKNITNIVTSFYCGDAGGRKGDYSDTDYKFALNCMINFYFPEQLFEKNKVFVSPTIKYPIFSQNIKEFVLDYNNKEMILMVGFPASGKSYLSKDIKQKAMTLKNICYVIINRDTLKTPEKCLKKTEETLQNNISVIIDNTNVTSNDRKKYIDIAKKYNYKIKCILVTTSIDLCKHNNYYRRFKTNLDIVPDIAYNYMKKNYQEPSLNEGYSEIIKYESEKIIDPDYYLYYF